MLQIIGRASCTQTRKVIRFCKERSIPHQFVDLKQRELSLGEWQNIFESVDEELLIDTSSPYYKKEGYAYRVYDIPEELQEHPELLVTPILRYKRRVVVGFDQEFILQVSEK
ncbi:MAG: arsenate reductase family protein [Sphaerochaetaceae bacterium]